MWFSVSVFVSFVVFPYCGIAVIQPSERPRKCTRLIFRASSNSIASRPKPKILAEFDSIDAIVSCVQEVKAISVLPEHACRWEAYPGIKVIPLKGDRWKRSVGLITPQLAAPLPAVSCFVDFLRNTATEKTF
jgi:DNA-binding transcriptional LysR family regulator